MGKSIKVLIVDDEPQLLEISKAFLEDLKGFVVETSLSAKDAIKRMRTTAYDIIVSDYQMPEVDGIELLESIRLCNDPIPFILFTGKGREDVAIKALNSGADFYLQKGGDPKTQFAELANMIVQSVQRHRAELDLIENEEKFKNIFNSTSDSIHILDFDGKVLEINDIGCDWLGYTRQEMVQKNVKDIDSVQYARQAQDRMKEVMEKGFALFEVDWVTKGGKLVPVEISARRINFAGRPAILSVARNVSERRMSEEILIENDRQIVSLNRMLAMLSQTNQMIVRAKSPQEIHDRVCEIAVQHGGFEHAWVGSNDRGSVAILASASESEIELPPRIREVMEAEELVLSTANCKGIPCLSHQTQNDAPDDIHAAGISGSVLILPVKVRGETRAFLGVHSAEEGYFSEDEMAIFQEMVMDVSFGWDSLLVEEDRSRAEEKLGQSEERYHQLFDNIGVGVAIYIATEDGSDFIIRDFNRGAQDIEKIKKEDVIGRKVTEVFPGIVEMGLLDVLRRVHQTGNPESHPLTLYHDDRISGYRENYIYRLPSGEIAAVYEDATSRKNAEASIEHLASFPLLNPDPVLELKTGTGIVYANASAYKVIRDLGKEEDLSLLLPKDLEDVIKAAKNSEDTNTIREVEVGGMTFQASIKVVPGTDLIRIYETDITEHKRAREELRRSEKRFRQLTEHGGTVIWEIDADGLFTYVSHASEAVYGGYRPDELVGKMHFFDLTPEAERESFRATVFDIIERKERFVNLENPVKTKDGRVIWVSTNGIPLLKADGTLQGYQGSDTDITKRKNAEDALRESERRYRLLADNVNDVIWILNIATQRFTYVSPSVRKLSGFTVEETMQRSLKDILHPDSYSDIMRQLPALIERFINGREAGMAQRLVARQRRRDGTWMEVEVVAALLQDDNGEFTEILGVTRDCTDRMNTERALQEVGKKLNLLSNVTRHDINNQLMALEGHLTLLTMQLPDIVSNDHLLQTEAAAKRISDMIHFTKEYEDIGVHAPMWQDVRALVRTAFGDLQLDKVNVVNDVPIGTEVFADPLIVKVFHNLINNAIRHGGNITTIHFFTEEHNGLHAIICEDDGVGISKEMKREIFTKSSEKDHGLGLFLSSEILSITGITISEKGETGHGAKFVMNVPPEGLRTSRIENSISLDIIESEGQ